MSVRLEISIDDGGLGAAMRRASAELGDLSVPLEATGALMEDRFTSRFDEQHGPGGIAWIPSKAAQGLVPRASGKIRPGKTLIDTGALRESMAHAVQGNQVEIGVQNPAPGNAQVYARPHQFGYLPGGIPARPFIGFDDQDTSDMEDLWTDVLRSAFDVA